jgi:hypothetical protein
MPSAHSGGRSSPVNPDTETPDGAAHATAQASRPQTHRVPPANGSSVPTPAPSTSTLGRRPHEQAADTPAVGTPLPRADVAATTPERTATVAQVPGATTGTSGTATGTPDAPTTGTSGTATDTSGRAERPEPRPKASGQLTKRIRGQQMPDTGGAASAIEQPRPRPERSAQSVRGDLESFNAGRRIASDVTLRNANPLRTPVAAPGSGEVPDPRSRTQAAPPEPPATTPNQAAPAPPTSTASPAPTATPAASAAEAPTPAATAASTRPETTKSPLPVTAASDPQPLPRRVRGAQMPATDLPTSAPPPERNAAQVRVALSNFIAGRRAAEHED